MESVLWGLSVFAWLVCLVSFVLVVITMFQYDRPGLGIACILLCGIGVLIAFVCGWMKSSEWGLRNVMFAWTAAALASVILQVLRLAVI